MNDIEEKYDLELDKYYRVSMLWKIVTDFGLSRTKQKSFTTDWLVRKIQAGVLILPPKKPEELYKLTGRQIIGIVYSFAPGGKGYYNWTDEIEPRED